MSIVDADSTPAVEAPAGYNSTLSHPPTLYRDTVVTVAISLVITITLVSSRLFTRIRLHREVNTEDWFLVAAEFSFIAFLALLIALPAQGAHEWNVSLSTADRFASLVNVLELIYVLPLLLSKTALMLQLKRIFTAGSTIRNFTYYALQSLIAFNIVAYAAIIIYAIVYIVHDNQDYNPDCSGECRNGNYILVATGVFNAAVDLVTIAIPLWAVRGLQMSSRKKFGVAAVFGVGSFACAASIMRAIRSFGPVNDQVDQTYTSMPVFCWAAAEIAAVISATSIPCLPKLWRELQARYHGRNAESESGMAIDYPLCDRPAGRKSEVCAVSFSRRDMSDADAAIEAALGGKYRESHLKDFEAGLDIASIQERMVELGLGLGIRTQTKIEGGSGVGRTRSDASTSFWSRGRSRKTSMDDDYGAAEASRNGLWGRGRSRRTSIEGSLREMPVPRKSWDEGDRDQSVHGGILKTVEVAVDISSI